MKSILFLSALDFKEKSIQVIKKTPEAYRDAGWEVTYLVARDNCPKGNYFYEKVIDLPGIRIIRSYWPLPKLRSMLPSDLAIIITKLVSWVVAIKLFLLAIKFVQKNNVDIIYGYEIQGILAMLLLKVIFKDKFKYVSRFQGSFIYEKLKNKDIKRLFFSLDHIFCLKSKVDLLIMTNDGTQGDKALQCLKSSNRDNYVFYKNGVDYPNINSEIIVNLRNIYKIDNDKTIILVSVSRLVNWKRIDRGLLFIKELQKLGLKVKYLIVGEGEAKAYLINLCNQLQITDIVNFIGAVPHENVCNYLEIADYFISFYDGSNVGNPLLESLRQGKIIFTLNNGDTNKFIKHKVNGFIYDFNDIDFKLIANDLIYCENNLAFAQKIKMNAIDFANKNLWSWNERFSEEIKLLNGMI